MSFDRLKANRGDFGALLESFVFSEVMKLLTGSELRLTPYLFGDQQMHEVDIALERDDGMIVGVVLYDSTDLVPFGDKLAAAPLSSLWG